MMEPSDAMTSPLPERAAEAERPATGGRSAILRGLIALAALLPLALVTFAAVSVVLPLTFGPMAFILIFEQQLFLAVFVLCAPIALLTRARGLLLGLLVAAVFFGGAFGSEWVSLPGAAGTRSDLSVMTWNLEFGARSPEDAVSALRGVTSDVVALEEMEPDVAAAIEADATLTARYPYRLMAPRDYAAGIGLMSRYPLSETESIDLPAGLRAVVAAPRGPVRVIAGHPNPAELRVFFHLPIAYDPTARDGRINVIREWIDASLARGERLLVVGDFNTTPTEPEYRVLTRGLRDTHTEIGVGPGWTWRPNRISFLGAGVIRIDLQLFAGSIRPSSTSLGCSLPGDHCQLFASYQLD